jgi:hypothetical protein
LAEEQKSDTNKKKAKVADAKGSIALSPSSASLTTAPSISSIEKKKAKRKPETDAEQARQGKKKAKVADAKVVRAPTSEEKYKKQKKKTEKSTSPMEKSSGALLSLFPSVTL